MIPYNSLVILINPKGKRYIKKLKEEDDWQTHYGKVRAADIHHATYGQIILSSTQQPILVEEATLQDILLGIKRQTQIIYPKDIAYICLRLGIGQGRTILEAGCGSGGLTLALSWFGGDNCTIISLDSREEFIKLTRRNLEWANLGLNVQLLHRDIEEGFPVKEADALFLDLREPWLYLGQVQAAVKPGATAGFLLPTINQVEKLILEMEKYPFGEIEICEILLRGWKALPDRIRPKDRMIAHTGFLIFCRQQTSFNKFNFTQSLDTRRRKEKDAWEKRNASLSFHIS